MSILAVAFVVGPLMLIGQLPAAAGQSALAPGSSAPVRLAAGDSTADRDTYARKAQAEMREWQQKLHDFGESAEGKGKAAGDAAGKDVHAAWTKAERASHKLRTVGAEGWDGARASFEKASRELAEAWHKIHPEDK